MSDIWYRFADLSGKTNKFLEECISFMSSLSLSWKSLWTFVNSMFLTSKYHFWKMLKRDSRGSYIAFQTIVCVVVIVVHHRVVKKRCFPTDSFDNVFNFIHDTFQIICLRWNRNVFQRISKIFWFYFGMRYLTVYFNK